MDMKLSDATLTDPELDKANNGDVVIFARILDEAVMEFVAVEFEAGCKPNLDSMLLVTPMFRGTINWDGCSDCYGNFHFCGFEHAQALGKTMDRAYALAQSMISENEIDLRIYKKAE